MANLIRPLLAPTEGVPMGQTLLTAVGASRARQLGTLRLGTVGRRIDIIARAQGRGTGPARMTPLRAEWYGEPPSPRGGDEQGRRER